MSTESITLFLCGDVMTGRGIDQALPHPSRPQLF
jgi:poly-gamma-glutamate synthesis protein (capsule biosynthesis protein)